MLRDLALEPPSEPLRTDIGIIGGGTVGLILAHLLSKAGRRVLVLESGGESAGGIADRLNAVEQTGDPYAGATEGRFRGLGGTSQAWGGALLPFVTEDFAAPFDRPGNAWPVDPAVLMAELPAIEKLFSLAPGPYTPTEGEASRLGIDRFAIRMPKWPSFGRRNVASLLGSGLSGDPRVQLWVNATASAFALDEGGRLSTVTARAANGNAMTVWAPQFILAAGALESARLLLLLDRQHGERIFGAGSVLGHYLHDHLSAPIAAIDPNDRAQINRTFSFRFEGSGMRSVRYELASAGRRSGTVAAFAHIAFEDDGRSGFTAIRTVLQALQSRRRPPISSLILLARQSPWVLRAIFWRYARHRVLAPTDVPFLAHLVTEQQPIHANRVGLSSTGKDMFGLAMASVHWTVTEDDVHQFRMIAAMFVEAWETSLGTGFGHLDLRALDGIQAVLAQGGGIYHPGGTTRMASHAGEGVVDGDLRCFNLPNLFVASTSVFPAGGGANPTLTLLLFAARLVRRLTGAGTV